MCRIGEVVGSFGGVRWDPEGRGDRSRLERRCGGEGGRGEVRLLGEFGSARWRRLVGREGKEGARP